MRVLVVGTVPSAIRRAEAVLRDGGHETVRCHEPGDASFPCAGLLEGRHCPLEGAVVDVVVDARSHPWPRPSRFEDGATCALRRHVPLVVLGTALQPFEPWVNRGIDDEADLVTACECAASAPQRRHEHVATKTAGNLLARARIDATDVRATVRRERGVLKVDLMLPAKAARLESTAVAKVLSTLRELDPYATGIDVSVTWTAARSRGVEDSDGEGTP